MPTAPGAEVTETVTRRGVGRARLSRQAILEAALSLVDREGATALSMRRLGQELGIEAMSLYTYIDSRDELLDGLSEVMVRALPQRTDAAWHETIRAFAGAIRSTAKRHPQAFLLVGMRPLTTPNALGPVDAVLAALHRGGFSITQAVAAYRLVASYARGFALAEIEGFTLDVGEVGVAPAATHPTVSAARATPGALDHDRGFGAGLDTIIAGLAGLVAPGQ